MDGHLQTYSKERGPKQAAHLYSHTNRHLTLNIMFTDTEKSLLLCLQTINNKVKPVGAGFSMEMDWLPATCCS